jgi:NADPH:quinone reductase-like Zn-dependent oxidoreductase
MKAILCTKYGPPEGLQFKEIEIPSPKEDEVLIRIHATTVTAGDVFLRRMTGPVRFIFGLFFDLGKNKILGHELAGEIEAVGEGVTRFKVGDPVFASAGNKGGAYAEYICLSEDRMIEFKPDNMTFEEAAAVPIGANTALHPSKSEYPGRTRSSDLRRLWKRRHLCCAARKTLWGGSDRSVQHQEYRHGEISGSRKGH